MTNMLLDILIGLAGCSVLALVAGPCIGNTLRVFGDSDGAPAPVRAKQPLKKAA
jgi:hypothetical protein